MKNVIAIDGPSGSGKSTVGKALARRLGGVYLDTGAMYRAVALAAKRNGISMDDGNALGELCRSLDLSLQADNDVPRVFLGEEDISQAIRSPEMDMLSSAVSAVREVRVAMTILQRKLAKGALVVAEGRDMGTVVFPGSVNKFFLTASPEIRAERRYRERLGKGEAVSPADVQSEMRKRDRQDSTRALAPLKAARDALIIDSSELTPVRVVEEICRHLKRGQLKVNNLRK
ncbi:MAG: (d)CMP kinase [Deltaproteobacteria bacterium]|nr:(d)CMP kinase [Deltaproteobacteria bacterium]MBW1817755.1 (d)CMP kinase [Deltaproteobacteria bacterium]MBW2283342.1 (d)CMP kinase [Deltaproteobacteria bacterium]